MPDVEGGGVETLFWRSAINFKLPKLKGVKEEEQSVQEKEEEKEEEKGVTLLFMLLAHSVYSMFI